MKAIVFLLVLLLFNPIFSTLQTGRHKDPEAYNDDDYTYDVTRVGHHQYDGRDIGIVRSDNLHNRRKEDKDVSRRKRQTVDENVLVLCDFDDVHYSSSPCNLRSAVADSDRPWLLMTGATPNANLTGVYSAYQGKTYLYMPSLNSVPGNFARVYLPVNYTGEFCFSFYYSMYGEGMGTLQIRQYESYERQPVIWAKSGNQGPGWQKAEVTLTFTVRPTVLTITGVRGQTPQSDIAIDYIMATKGPCGGFLCNAVDCQWSEWSDFPSCPPTAPPSPWLRQRTMEQVPQCGGVECLDGAVRLYNCCLSIPCDQLEWASWSTCSDNSRTRQRRELNCGKISCVDSKETESCTDLFSCDFEEHECAMKVTDTEWYVGEGEDQKYGPDSGYNGSASFLYPLGNFPGILRRVITPPLLYTGYVNISFAYYLYDRALGSFSVVVKTDRHLRVLKTYSGDLGRSWQLSNVQAEIKGNNSIGWMIFSSGGDYAMALDNIVITPLMYSGNSQPSTACRAPPLSGRLSIVNSQRANQYAINQEVEFACERGFQMKGLVKRKCLLDSFGSAYWSGHEQSCIPVKCCDPGVPTNCRRDGFNNEYGGRVMYSALEGYALFGAMTLVCTENGTWSSGLPQCLPFQCDPLPQLPNGRLLSSERTPGTRAQFSCSSGFRLVGDAEMMCGYDYKWHGSQPQCLQTEMQKSYWCSEGRQPSLLGHPERRQ